MLASKDTQISLQVVRHWHGTFALVLIAGPGETVVEDRYLEAREAEISGASPLCYGDRVSRFSYAKVTFMEISMLQ